MSENVSLALSQASSIRQLCDFLDSEAIEFAMNRSVPVTMPFDVGSLGFDKPLWLGLGIVGLWAALDAFAERQKLPKPASKCPTCDRNCVSWRLLNTLKLDAADEQVLGELEDLRHLFAHNFAGRADAEYLLKKRHVLQKGGANTTLSSGAVFDSFRCPLDTRHLRYYADRTLEIIDKLK